MDSPAVRLPATFLLLPKRVMLLLPRLPAVVFPASFVALLSTSSHLSAGPAHHARVRTRLAEVATLAKPEDVVGAAVSRKG